MSSSAGTIDADVNITINAEDNATVKVETAAKKINRQWREMRLEQRAVQQQFELTNRRFVATSRVLQSVGSVVSRVQSAFNTYQLAQLRVQTATKNAADAQRDLNDAIVEFGLGSPEALEAARRNIEATNQIEQSNRDLGLSYAFIGLTLATAFGGVPKIIGNLKNLRSVLKGVSGAATKTATGGLGAATGGGIGSRITGAIGKFGPKLAAGAAGFGIGAAIGIASDIQPAGGPTVGAGGQVIEPEPLPGGLDAFGPLAEKIGSTIINVFASTPQEIVTEIQNSIDRFTRFNGQ